MIVDGTNLIVGRVSSYVAKRALEGEQIDIINCEKMVVTGNKKTLFVKLNHRDKMGTPVHGPFLQKMPDRFVRRSIRGMLPYKKENGKKAYKRIKCYIGVPFHLRDKEARRLQHADAKKLKTMAYVTVKEISEFLGRKV